MELFFKSKATPELAALTTAFGILDTRVSELNRLVEVHKQLKSQRVPESHAEHELRERRVEVSLVRLHRLNAALFPLIEPFKATCEALDATSGQSGHDPRLLKIVKGNVTSARELYDCAANLHYALDLIDSGFYIFAIDHAYKAPVLGERVDQRDLFIEATETAELAGLTTAFGELDTKMKELSRLVEEHKQLVGQRVKPSHSEYLLRERRVELSLLRLDELNAELWLLLEPFKTTYLAADATIVALETGHHFRSLQVVKNNVTCGRELSAQAAHLHSAVKLLSNGLCSNAIEFAYATTKVSDERHYVVCFNSQETFSPPYMTPEEAWKYNCHSHSISNHTGDVVDMRTGEKVNEVQVYEAYMKARGLTPYKQTE